MSSKVVLHYFQGKGLGEQIRLMLWEAGVQYEERYVDTKQKMDALRDSGALMFKQLPLLEMDGMKLVQTGATVRHLARKYGLYGKSDTDAVQCDMLGDGVREVLQKLAGYLFQENKDAFKAEYLPLLSRYFNCFTDFLSRNNAGKEQGFLLGDYITYPDVILFDVLERVAEYFPSFLDDYPLLVAFHKRMATRDSIKGLQSSRVLLPNEAYLQQVRAVLKKD